MGRFTLPQFWKQSPPPSTGEMLAEYAANQAAVLELPGSAPPETLAIVDGRISPTRAAVIVDTEGEGAADDLEIINPVRDDTDSLHEGMLLSLRAKDPARVVTVRHSEAEHGVRLVHGGHVVLGVDRDLSLMLRNNAWHEVRTTARAADDCEGLVSLATQAQAEGGDEGGAYAMTPLRTSQHLAAKFSGHFDTALAAQTGAEPVANKIPLADGHGKLASGWLPAGTHEQPGAVKLTSTPSATDESAAITPKGAHDTVVANAGKVSLLSTRSTTGDWTITGLTVGKPLFVLMSRGASAATYAYLYAHSGAADGTSPYQSYGFVIGHTSGYAASNTFTCVPTESTVTLKIIDLAGGAVLRAYQ